MEKHDHDIDETLRETSLTHTTQKIVGKKDFSSEVRGARDVSKFLEQSEVLLDITETELEPIVDHLLNIMMKDSNETVTRDEIKSVVFSDESRTMFSEYLQATFRTDRGASIGVEQTWLCATITVPTLNHRHVGIARLKKDANLGPQAEEVKFVILVMCPSEVKLTKTAIETGRTFATLFADANLKHDLLDVNSVEDFKELIKNASEDFRQRQVNFINAINFQYLILN